MWQRCVEVGIDINAFNHKGQMITLLKYAISWDARDVVNSLYEQGANLDVCEETYAPSDISSIASTV